MFWTIKQAAEETGISVDTLRYYEQQGIILPKRHENGYRYYDEADIIILKNIVVMKYAHFTLSEMRNIEELFIKKPSAQCNEIGKNVLNAKVSELNQAISNYQKITRLIEELLAMIDSVDSYQSNKKAMDGFINQIFDDIQKEKTAQTDVLSITDKRKGR